VKKLIIDIVVSDWRIFSEQALDAGCKYLVFARLRVIALHDAHARERFGEPPLTSALSFRAFAKDRRITAKAFRSENMLTSAKV